MKANIYRHFLTHEIMMPLASPKSGYVKVIKTEEEGSDVDLALHCDWQYH